MVGKDYESQGITKDGAKMIMAQTCSEVPKFTVIVNGSFGAGNYALCGKAFDPHFIFAWPSAKYAVMGGAYSGDVARNVLFENPGHGSAWVTLDLVGSRSRDPFGARVELHRGDRVDVFHSRPRNGYLGQGDPRLHLGLGDEAGAIDRVRVEWPGGEVTEIADVATRRIVRIEETL